MFIETVPSTKIDKILSKARKVEFKLKLPSVTKIRSEHSSFISKC